MNKEEFDKYLSKANFDIQNMEERRNLKEYVASLLCDNDKKEQEIKQLNKKYNKALEILNEYGMPCERDNFNLLDTDYCEINCSNDEEQFKKCWDEFIKWRLDKDE